MLCARRRRGVTISSLEPYGTAVRAGLLVGDVIVSINGELALTHAVVSNAIRTTASTHLELVVVNDLRETIIECDNYGGLTIANAPSDGALLVINVDDQSPSAAAGLAVGDVVVALNGKELWGGKRTRSIEHAAFFERLTSSPYALCQLVLQHTEQREEEAMQLATSIRARPPPRPGSALPSSVSERLRRFSLNGSVEAQESNVIYSSPAESSNQPLMSSDMPVRHHGQAGMDVKV